MTKRHKDAIAVQAGACNPSAIAIAITEACREMRAEPDHQGNDQITSDPAIRLMVHQLAFLCRVSEIDNDLAVYARLGEACAVAD